MSRKTCGSKKEEKKFRGAFLEEHSQQPSFHTTTTIWAAISETASITRQPGSPNGRSKMARYETCDCKAYQHASMHQPTRISRIDSLSTPLQAAAIWTLGGKHRQITGPARVRTRFWTIRFLDRCTAGPVRPRLAPASPQPRPSPRPVQSRPAAPLQPTLSPASLFRPV